MDEFSPENISALGKAPSKVFFLTRTLLITTTLIIC